MNMARDFSALGEHVNIEVYEAEIIEIDEAGLFSDFPTRRCHHVDIGALYMTPRLQPPRQLSVVNQGHLRERRMEHEC